MANNRMYLANLYLKRMVFLGKTMGGEWYRTTDVNAELDKLFYDSFGDDFCIALESVPPHAKFVTGVMDLDFPPAESESPMSDACPFCKVAGFDLINLKAHLLNGGCQPFNETPGPQYGRGATGTV